MCDIRAKDIIQWQNEQISYRDEKGKGYDEEVSGTGREIPVCDCP